jgi:predicted transcriptional regulator
MENAVKKQQTHLQSTYNPMMFKTFIGALEAFFAQECPQLGGFRTRQVLVQAVLGMVNEFYPETTHLRQGQIQWVTVDKDETASYGKSMRETKLKSVVLDLVRSKDIAERAEGKRLREIKKEAAVRLFKQADDQNGCMTNAEVAILLKISPPTVGRYIHEHEFETNELVPRRGTIHDMGPTLTHKKPIIRKLFLEGKSVGQVSRETRHSPEAIHRYIRNFKQVLLCRQKGLDEKETAFAVKVSERLVREYHKLIDKFAEENVVLESILQYTGKEL